MSEHSSVSFLFHRDPFQFGAGAALRPRPGRPFFPTDLVPQTTGTTKTPNTYYFAPIDQSIPVNGLLGRSGSSLPDGCQHRIRVLIIIAIISRKAGSNDVGWDGESFEALFANSQGAVDCRR
jgi:hypothetical protein